MLSTQATPVYKAGQNINASIPFWPEKCWKPCILHNSNIIFIPSSCPGLANTSESLDLRLCNVRASGGVCSFCFLVLDFFIEKIMFLRIRLKAEWNPGEKVAKSQNLVLMRFWCSFVTPQGTIKFPPNIISLLSQLDLFIGVQCSLGNVHSWNIFIS